MSGISVAAADLEHRSATLIAAGAAIDDARLAAAWASMERLVAAYLERLDAIDIWMTPTLGAEIPRIGVFGPDVAWPDQRDTLIDYAGYCWIDNFAGTPAITPPMGFSDNGCRWASSSRQAPGARRCCWRSPISSKRRPDGGGTPRRCGSATIDADCAETTKGRPRGDGPSIVLLHAGGLAGHGPREDGHARSCRMRRVTMRHSTTSFRLLTMKRRWAAIADNSRWLVFSCFPSAKPCDRHRTMPCAKPFTPIE
ncbi:amidase family protein [Sphingopyxis sp. JAI128]|uniref:amidase family protein n=1 Tax=Sphingopyxis sp. JAI128 TaxID=2723066 RepID=UPI0016092631|nr:amidase family protein [Sphingopyxis sp. JAI128]MBB6427777.1 hypothetical protein [Sphingopyxis sp. JAI128]